MSEMTITRALNELKLLDKRINDKINSGTFIGCAKKSSEKVNNIYNECWVVDIVETFTSRITIKLSYFSIFNL